VAEGRGLLPKSVQLLPPPTVDLHQRTEPTAIMRAMLAVTTALAAAAAETRGTALMDEVVLLQQVKAADAPGDDAQFELICDEIHGCHYDLHTSTPPPYLACDEKKGCRYIGLEPPKKKSPPGLFELPDPATLAATWELKNAEAMGSVVGKASRQMARWATEYRGALSGRWLKPNWTRGEAVGDMADYSLGTIMHLVRTHEMKPPNIRHPGAPFGYFMGFHMTQCVDGEIDRITEVLELLKISPIASGYTDSKVVEGTCWSRGYKLGPMPLFCFMSANAYSSEEHPGSPMDIFSPMAAYSAKYGVQATNAKMSSLCS